MRIGDRTIGRVGAGSVYVIAEIGVNHDGSASRAVDLVECAARSGADAVKLQLFEADRLLSAGARLAAYQAGAGESDPVEMLARLELSDGGIGAAVEACRRHGLGAIATIFSVELVDKAERFGFDAYKTASPDIIHRPLIDELLASGRPLIVSTGASTRAEVARCASWLADVSGRAAMLHCVSAYPVPPEHAAIGALHDLASIFDGPIGYSDHTRSEVTGEVAVRHGAVILEKHVTYDRSARGPDHASSLDEAGLTRYIERARRAARAGVHAGMATSGPSLRPADEQDDGPMVGPPVKRVLEIEADVRAVSRQSVVTARALQAGDRIGPSDLTCKRPGDGIEPWRIEDVIGRSAARPIGADRPLRWEDLA